MIKPGRYRNEKLEPYVPGEPYFEIDWNGNKMWKSKKGYLHRTDGHALIFANGSKYHYLHGQQKSGFGVKRPKLQYKSGCKIFRSYHRR